MPTLTQKHIVTVASKIPDQNLQFSVVNPSATAEKFKTTEIKNSDIKTTPTLSYAIY